MNAKFLIPIIAGTLFTLSAEAHDCSGGTDGGMDASGNQCNDATSVATNNSSGRPTSPSARAPNGQSSEAPTANKSVAKRTVATRQTPARSQSKHS